jgi:hypothetical protein
VPIFDVIVFAVLIFFTSRWRHDPATYKRFNEPNFPKTVQKKADPRPGCADHLSEGLLTDLRDYAPVLTFL